MDPRQQSDDRSLADRPDAKTDEWTVADLIDFEYYLDADERELREKPASRKTSCERDRAIYLDKIEGRTGAEKPHSPSHRRTSLRIWLAARRTSEDPSIRALLPGHAFGTAQRIGTKLLAGLGFLLGIGVASTLLNYDGRVPVSVPWFVFLLVVMQFVFVLAAVWTWTRRGLRRETSAVEESWLLTHAIRPLLTRAANWLQQQRLAHATDEVRERALATQGLLRSQYAVYGPVSILPLLILAQVFGVAFNVGVVLTTLTLEWFTDIAFGWGTSLAAHPQTVFDIVRVIAAPWSWLFGEGVGYPTLEQVEGSRIYMEHWASFAQGIKPDPEHLRSWRWFLVLAVMTYGLLPRLLLLGASVLAQRFALARLTFTHGRIQGLYARMLTPRLDTHCSESGQGPEMPIPSALTSRGPRSGLIGPLTEGTLPAGARPWRDAPGVLREDPVHRKPPAEAAPSEPTPSGEKTAPADVTQPQPAPAPTPTPTPERTVPEAEKTPERVIAEPVRSDGAAEPTETLVEDVTPTIAQPEPAPQEEIALARPEPEPKPKPELKPEPAPKSELKPKPEPKPEPASPPTTTRDGANVFAPDACLLLAHVDIDDVLEASDRPRLEQLLLELSGWRVGHYATFGAGSAMTTRVLKLLEAGDWHAPPPRIAIVQDGSQPPITENLLFLRELRAAAGPHAQILLALVGDPEDDDRLPALRRFDYTDWQRKIDQMADPYLRLEMLAPSSEDGEA